MHFYWLKPQAWGNLLQPPQETNLSGKGIYPQIVDMNTKTMFCFDLTKGLKELILCIYFLVPRGYSRRCKIQNQTQGIQSRIAYVEIIQGDMRKAREMHAC